MDKKYDAFISYRHMELDDYVAETLMMELERFKAPRRLASGGKNKITGIFRDKENLALAADLSEIIYEALQESEYLIVICTPRIRQSVWCRKEIEYFISQHGREKVLAVLAEGEPADSFPDILTAGGAEPLAADVRGKNKWEVRKKIKAEVVRMASVLLGIDYGELRQKKREESLSQKLFAAIGFAVFFAFIGSITTYQAARISTQAERINKLYLENIVKQAELTMKEVNSRMGDGDVNGAISLVLDSIPEDKENIPEEFWQYTYSSLSEALGVYKNGNEVRPYRSIEAGAKVDEIYVSDDGRYLIYSDAADKVCVWSIEDFHKIFETTLDEFYFHPGNIGFAVVSDYLIYQNSEKVVCRDLKTGDTVYEMASDSISYIFPVDDESLLILSDEGEIIRMTASDGTVTGKLKDLKQNFDGLRSYAVSDSGKYLYLCVSRDGVNRIVTINLYDFTLNAEKIMTNMDKGLICQGDQAYAIRIIDPYEGESISKLLRFSPDLSYEEIFIEVDDSVVDMNLVGSDRLLLYTDGCIKLYAIDEKKIIGSYDYYLRDMLRGQLDKNGCIRIYFEDGKCEKTEVEYFCFSQSTKLSLPYATYKYISMAGDMCVSCIEATNTIVIYSEAMTEYAEKTDCESKSFYDLPKSRFMNIDSFTTENGLYSVRFDNNILYISSGEEQIATYSLEDENPDPTDNIIPFGISEDGKYLFIAGILNTVKIVSLEDMTVVAETPELGGDVVLLETADCFLLGDYDTAFLYTKDKCIKIGEVNGFVDYNKENNSFYLSSGTGSKVLYEVPFYSLDQLIAFAEKVVEEN